MNCATQTNSQMLLRDWEEFFTHPERDDTKLNVISLEFSQTKLESYVTAPRLLSYHSNQIIASFPNYLNIDHNDTELSSVCRVVRQIDWVDNVWPRHLKEDQEDGTNDMRSMMYPKVINKVISSSLI